MLVLGIETSCDETGLALVADGRKILGTQLASSLPAHQRYGGVVPEIASRAHVELLTYELENLLNSCRISPQQIDRIAVTYGPGLSGALVVGVAAAKALALAWRKELTGVNHLQAHLYAALLDRPDWPWDARMVGLVVSGGHTAIVHMMEEAPLTRDSPGTVQHRCTRNLEEGIRRFRLLGQTRDDAVGEAFDKVAKLLGLRFPGGPEIERMSRDGNPRAFRFSVPRIKGGSPYDFSLSGIKTAVLYKIRGEREDRADSLSAIRYPLSADFVADMAASFQRAIVEEVVDKTITACRVSGVTRLVVGGGVVANRMLRTRLREAAGKHGIELAVPAPELCTDNGAMVAGLGFHTPPMDPRRLTVAPDLRVETEVVE